MNVILQLLSTVHMAECNIQWWEVQVHLGAMERGMDSAAGPPLQAEPVKLRGGMWRPFVVSLAEMGGEACTLELSESSLCSISIKVNRLPTLTFLAHIRGLLRRGGRGRSRGKEQHAGGSLPCHIGF